MDQALKAVLPRRENTRKLKASGNVLTNLVGSLDGRLFSNIIWRFSLDPLSPGAAKEGGPPGEAPEGGEQQLALPELPYHRFSNGDGILVVSTLPNGELPKADLSQASRASQHLFSLVP
ncbi:hypothetical protein MMC34_008667 [Xylographa carneopallida]|nr:hypothetical protein [Xylographa carneopallida]